jgi:hypothetical protein
VGRIKYTKFVIEIGIALHYGDNISYHFKSYPLPYYSPRGRWSSVRANLAGRDDGLVTVGPLLECCGEGFGGRIDEPPPPTWSRRRASETIGRPRGSPAFLDAPAAQTGRDPRPRRPGPRG